MAYTFQSFSVTGATFADGSTLSGTWSAEYDDSGNLIAIVNPDLTITSADGTQTTQFTNSNGTSASNGAYQMFSQGNGGGFYNLYLDWNGENPTTLSSGGAMYTSVVNPAGQTETLVSTGTVSNVATAVTSSISGAEFADGSTLAGTWTGIYDQSGTLVGVENASFTVTGPQGSTTFTEAGTLPYADSGTSSSYEIHFQSSTDDGGGYQSLYVDWKSENPSSLYEGTPSLYTSVVNTSTGSTSPIRLIDDGTTGAGDTPVIGGLPAAETGSDDAVLSPFSGVTVTDNGSSSVSATITLNTPDGTTDDNGTLAGTDLTRTGVGTYQISAETPGQLTSDLQSVTFTPTADQAAPGSQTTTRIGLAINDADGSASSSTDLAVTATCFLPGTLLATPVGERAIETLVHGDLVTVVVDGIPATAPIVWAGSGRMDVTDAGCGDAGFPVRIRAGAFGDDLPRRDLLVTPEHCLLVDGGLIPARMLVNGVSIVVDRSIPSYAFHHVELERHGILLAEGLPVESYLDSGNRHLFGDEAAAMPDRVRTGAPAMAAPLRTARAQVEPVWRRLRDHAATLGLPMPVERGVVAGDPELRVLLDDGRLVHPDALRRDRLLFHIPRGRQPVRLLSKSAVPADVVGPFLDDRRRLGVAIDRLVLRQGSRTYEPALEALDLEGWHAMEHDRRWTDGNARLALPRAEIDAFLDIRLVGVMARAA